MFRTTIFIGATIFACFSSVFAQGMLEVNQDPRLDKMSREFIEHHRKRSSIDGYRIQIFSGDKNGADQTKQTFAEVYKYIFSMVIYDAPNWKVYVGNYRNKVEAQKDIRTVRGRFPNAIIVKDRVSLKAIYKTE